MSRLIGALLGAALVLAACSSDRGPDLEAFGSPVVDGVFTFTVNDFQCGSVEVSRGTTRKAAAAQYCLVDLTVINTGTLARRFDFEAQGLLDEDGLEIPADLEASLIINPARETAELAPEETLSTRIVFDVANPVALTAVHLHESIFSDGVETPIRP